MSDPYTPPPGYTPQGYVPPGYGQPGSARPGMNCFVKGCLTVGVVLGILGVIAWGIGYYIFSEAKEFVSQTPVAIRTAPATEAQYQAVYDRYRQFTEALARGEAAKLSLSADDLNTLIARDPAAKDLKGKVFLTISGDELTAETCFPLPKGDNALPTTQTYYFGGKVRLAASYSSGEFTFVLREIKTMDGKPAPHLVNGLVDNPAFTNAFNHNFNEAFHREADRNPTTSAVLSRVRTVILQDGQVVITADQGPPLRLPEPVASPSASE